MKTFFAALLLVLLASCTSYKKTVYYVNPDGFVKLEYTSIDSSDSKTDTNSILMENGYYHGIYIYDIFIKNDSINKEQITKYSLLKDCSSHYINDDLKALNLIEYGTDEENEMKIIINIESHLGFDKHRNTFDERQTKQNLSKLKKMIKNKAEVERDSFLYEYEFHLPDGAVIESEDISLSGGVFKINANSYNFHKAQEKMLKNEEWLKQRASVLEITNTTHYSELWADEDFYKEFLGLKTLKPYIIIKDPKPVFDSKDELRRAKEQWEKLKKYFEEDGNKAGN